MLAGSVALASAAFAIGSQAGDGSADAHGDRGGRAALFGGGPPGAGHLRGGPRGFESLADRLGVSESRLRDALRDLRPVVKVPEDIAERARLPIERMVAIS